MDKFIEVFTYIDGTKFPVLLRTDRIKYTFITPLQRKIDPTHAFGIVVSFTDGEEKIYTSSSLEEITDCFNKIREGLCIKHDKNDTETNSVKAAQYLKEVLNKNLFDEGEPHVDLCSPFTTRTYNCLNDEGILTIRDLVRYAEREVFAIPNIGRKSLNEIKQLLEDLSKIYAVNLHLGMEGI